jgi:putative transposase
VACTPKTQPILR